MIAHLRGRVAARGPASIVVDVDGVGYLVHTATVDRFPAQGQPVEVHTSLQVREDAMTLYGFADAATRDLFELLLTSSGVGPKLGLAALATHRPEVLCRALVDEDVAVLTLIPGVGRKVAQRLVLELRDKVGGAGPTGAALPGAGAALEDEPATTAVAEVREALGHLGYAPAEVADALGRLDADGDPADLLRAALRHLGGALAGGRV